MKQRAAFFDLDNTLIEGSSLCYFLKGLIRHGEITKRHLARIALEHYRFQRKKTESESAMTLATKKLLEFAIDRPQSHLIELCQKIVEDFLPRSINEEVRKRIHEHQAQGIDTWIITASPVELAEIVAHDLNMTGALGTRGEVINGLYSGRVLEGAMHGKKKATSLITLAEQKGYDLEKSFAYSDSINDLPMLISVGNPHIVNPNKELTLIARKNNWPIVA